MPGTASHTKIRLSGKGMKKVSGYGHGDHYVTFKIVVPKKLDEKQKALIMAYAELEKDTPGQIMGVTFKKDGKRALIFFFLLKFNITKMSTDVVTYNFD